MTYLSARRRRELVLLPQMVFGLAWQVLSDGNNDRPREGVDAAFRHRVLDRLENAMLEPIQDLPRDEQIKTLGRLRKVRLWLLEPWEHSADVFQIMVGAHELMRLLQEAGYLALVEGSSFALAWDEFVTELTELEANAARIEMVEPEGRAMAVVLLRRLQSKGLFCDPALVELAAAA
jgi:hypothetical protein